jgi:predicted SAM-dependent methyltransferase
MDPACQPDLLLTNNDFSQFERQSFQEILANDVLEHIPRAETGAALLEWADILAMGGTIKVETSNVIAVSDLMKIHTSYADHANYTVYMFGNQAHPGDWHHTGFTDVTLRVHLMSAGFEVTDIKETQIWLLNATARKIENWSTLASRDDLSNPEFVNAACQAALFREVEQPFFSLWQSWLDAGAYSRRAFLKMLYASDERRMRIAQRNGL